MLLVRGLRWAGRKKRCHPTLVLVAQPNMDAVPFAEQRAGVEVQHAQARRRREVLLGWVTMYAVLTHRTPTFHEGAPGLGKCRHPL